ncbi:helix-turn-helix transcriptional regulator [Eubacteriaceae bacterium ES3]|nr:helix-turn-helix transcriptional regulator [Eubacteriaceae bacterium ES3]
MIDKNIRILRKSKNWSQEKLAEKVDVSRQTIAKWENGVSVPDIYQCHILSDIFEISLEALCYDHDEDSLLSLAPKGKHFFGVIKMNENRELILPKNACELYQFSADDKLVILGDDDSQGIAIIKANRFLNFAKMIEKAGRDCDE